jgi:5-methylcytosine-specific restriction protein A
MRSEFTPKTKAEAARRAGGKDGNCERCGHAFKKVGGPEYHHRLACHLGGDNSPENCQAICTLCHAKASKKEAYERAKAERAFRASVNATPPRRKFQGVGFRKADPQRTATTPPEREGNS